MTGPRVVLAALTFGWGAAAAQSGGIKAPVSGFVNDAQVHSIRAIQGFPGAAVLGAAVALSDGIRDAKFSRDGKFGLAIAARETRELYFVRDLQSVAPSISLMEGAIQGADLIALGEGGGVVVSTAAHLLQYITGLPDQPVAQTAIALDSLAGSAVSVAVDVEAGLALVGMWDGSQGAVYQITSQGGVIVQLCTTTGRPSAVAYINHAQAAVYADGSSRQVVLIQDLRGGKATRALMGAADGIADPIALQVDGTKVLVASAEPGSSADVSGAVLVYDLDAGQVVANQPLSVAPTRLDRLLLSGLFVVNDTGAGPLYLFSAAEATLAFVPPAAQ